MLRTLLPLLVLGLAGCASAPVATSAPQPIPTPVPAKVVAAQATPAPAEWHNYADKRFSVKLPTPPHVTREKNRTRVQSVRNGEVFLVTALHLPHRSSEADLQKFCKDFTRRMSARGSQVVKQQQLTFQGYPALDLEVKSRGGGLLVNNRLIWADDQFYSLSRVAGTEDPQGVQQMWDSFRLTKS